MNIVPILLFLHVLGAILAFGPTFAYSIMGAMAGREPQHANFSSRQVEAIGNTLVYPLAIFQGITGVLLHPERPDQPSEQLWLALGIVLYLIALTYCADGPAERAAPPDRVDVDAAAARVPAGPPPGDPGHGQEDPARRDAPRPARSSSSSS